MIDPSRKGGREGRRRGSHLLSNEWVNEVVINTISYDYYYLYLVCTGGRLYDRSFKEGREGRRRGPHLLSNEWVDEVVINTISYDYYYLFLVRTGGRVTVPSRKGGRGGGGDLTCSLMSGSMR